MGQPLKGGKMKLYQKLLALNKLYDSSTHEPKKPKLITFDTCKTIIVHELLTRAKQGCTTFSAAISPYAVNPGVFNLGTTGNINKDRIIAVDLKKWLKTENMDPCLSPSISIDQINDPFYAFYLDMSWKRVSENKEEITDAYKGVRQLIKEKIEEATQKYLKIGIRKIADNLVISIEHNNKIVDQLYILEQETLTYQTLFSARVYYFCEDTVRRYAEYAINMLFQIIVKELAATALCAAMQKKLGVTDEDIKGWWNDLDTECDREWVDKIKKGTS